MQGFPPSFDFPDIPPKSMYKQCDNTVVEPVIKRIVTQPMLVIGDFFDNN